MAFAAARINSINKAAAGLGIRFLKVMISVGGVSIGLSGGNIF
jgi:hypothetical protein